MIAKLKSKLKAVFKKVLKQDGGEFAKRIRHRNSEFWGSAEGKMIKAVPMDASAPLAEWQNINNWQRRLSNKHNSIEFAKKFGCRVPMLYWEGKDLADFRSKSFPEHYVVKPTLGAGSKLVFLMNGSYNLMDK
ncbi:hypothetical protein ACSX1A_12375 [Pontibacter sp. MBLB2868]|uniref:hypothetical protein n=1 Tax=Pontibacter sp. MBLB2868 TaxID=3451555 RepID=UPI003F7527B8